MVKIIDTLTLEEDMAKGNLTVSEIYWVYNGLDCCITNEIRHKLREQLTPTTRATYSRALEMQGPFLEMMLRGVRLSESHRTEKMIVIKEQLSRLEYGFNRLCSEGLGLPYVLNWRSPKQVKALFYDILAYKPIKARNTMGFYAPTVGREALETLSVNYVAEPFCNFILAMRDIGKQIGFLETKLDADKRLRCNFNLAGTNTGRLSSSFSDFGTGTNLQNVDRNLKYTFIPDEGKAFINIDLEQADSRNVGALCWDMFVDMPREGITRLLRKAGLVKADANWEGPIGPEFAGSYLDACESGDLHTTVCRMAWKDLDWGTVPEGWRAIADGNAYRTYSYRDMAKKLGHGTNYLGQPKTMAMHTKVPADQITLFQHNYFAAFPCIAAWQQATIELLQTTGQLTHLFGRQRCFFGRHTDQPVINAAIAYCPQGMTGDQINEGILELWKDRRFELLIQVHDSILLQVDSRDLNELTPVSVALMKAERTLKQGRVFSVPLEAKVGWNWGDADKRDLSKNPSGLLDYKGNEQRTPPKFIQPKRLSLKELR